MTTIVYAVKISERNEELRYSLRSIARNFPHDKVVIAGHKPAWVRNVTHVDPKGFHPDKYAQTAANWYAACKLLDEPFIMFNDDFFVMKQIDELPVYHAGLLVERILHYEGIQPGSNYLAGMKATLAVLQRGVGDQTDFLSYGLHVPMSIRPAAFRNMLEHVAKPGMHLRTLYGNMAQVGGEKRCDVKVSSRRMEWDRDSDFLSTDDRSWLTHEVGEHIRRTFDEPCQYERGW